MDLLLVIYSRLIAWKLLFHRYPFNLIYRLSVSRFQRTVFVVHWSILIVRPPYVLVLLHFIEFRTGNHAMYTILWTHFSWLYSVFCKPKSIIVRFTRNSRQEWRETVDVKLLSLCWWTVTLISHWNQSNNKSTTLYLKPYVI